MAGSSQPSSPPPQDAFSQSLVSRLWPQSGYRGAMQSPYLPVVQPLMQQPQGMDLGSMMQQASPMGPAAINKPKPAPPPGGSNPSGFGALMTLIDPVGGTTFGGYSPK